MYSKLDFNRNFREKVEILCRQEFKIGRDGRLEPRHVEGARPMPWLFINHDPRKKFCWFWNKVCTGIFNLIPTHCRWGCWKVVIKPNNVKELFECYEIMTSLDLPSKVGMDLRDYTHGAWAGFVYADTQEEGQKYWEMVRKAMPKRIKVILKRGCTEMERLRPSDTWDEITEAELQMERRLQDLFSFRERAYMQAAWNKHELKEKWIKHAIKIGDPTAKETAEKYSGDPNVWDRLVVDSITYHNDDVGKKK